MTLEQKANQLQVQLVKSFDSSDIMTLLQSISDARHDRFGLSSYCDMPIWGDVSRCVFHSAASAGAASSNMLMPIVGVSRVMMTMMDCGHACMQPDWPSSMQ
jgi:hypothetical protein